jgi:ATP-dependent helicase/DNAse subunit B
MAQIRSGRVEVRPADAENCRFCDYRDACRVETASSDMRQDPSAGMSAGAAGESARGTGEMDG